MTEKTDSATVLLRLVALIGIFMINMELFMIMLSLVKISEAWSIDASHLQWIISVYYLFFAAFTVISGELVDRFGSTRVMFYSFATYLVLSFFAALSWSFLALLIIRCLKGMVAAALFNASLSTLLNSYQRGNKLSAMSLVVAVTAVASAIGPFVAAGVLSNFSWRYIFVVNIILIMIALTLFAIAKPVMPIPKQKTRIKYREGLIFTVAAFLIMYGINQLGPFQILWQWLTPLIVGFLILAFFILLEAKSANPLLDIDLLRNRHCLTANIIRFFIQGLAFFYFFALSLIVQINLDLSQLETAALFTTLSVSQLFSSLVIKKLSNLVGYKSMIIFCLSLISAACFFLSTPGVAQNIWLIMLGNIGIAVSIGMMLALLTTYVVLHVEPERVGRANGLIYTFAFSGASIMLALLNEVMVFYANNFWQSILKKVPDLELTTAQYQSLLHISVGGSLKEAHLDKLFPPDLIPALLKITHTAFFSAYHGAMFWLGIFGTLMLILSFTIKET